MLVNEIEALSNWTLANFGILLTNKELKEIVQQIRTWGNDVLAVLPNGEYIVARKKKGYYEFLTKQQYDVKIEHIQRRQEEERRKQINEYVLKQREAAKLIKVDYKPKPNSRTIYEGYDNTKNGRKHSK